MYQKNQKGLYLDIQLGEATPSTLWEGLKLVVKFNSKHDGTSQPNVTHDAESYHYSCCRPE
jgi:hypothetical protein